MGSSAQDADGNRRGPYSNGVQRRQDLLEAAFLAFAEQGYAGSSLRDVAQRAGASHAVLIHHFGSKARLLQAVLLRREEIDGPIRRRLLDELGVRRGAVEIMRRNARTPGLIALDSILSAEAIESDHPAHQFFQERFTAFYELVLQGLMQESARGNIRTDISLEVTSRQFVSLVQGLQTQWLYDPAVDMATHVEAFFELVAP